jgi:hypothetical protein
VIPIDMKSTSDVCNFHRLRLMRHRQTIRSVILVTALLASALSAHAGYPNGAPGGNLSGYAQTGAIYTSVAAKWRVPVVSFGADTSFNSNLQWIGVTGLAANAGDIGGIIQGGTGQDIAASTGDVSYYGWYASADGGVQKISCLRYPVRPGDVMSGSVSCTADCMPSTKATWSFVLQDLTQNWTFTQVHSISGAMHSTEVIEEATSNGVGSSYVWPNFGTVVLMNVTIDDGEPMLSTLDESYSDNVTATSNPSDPNDAGDGFNVSWGMPGTYTVCATTTSLTDEDISR